MRKGIAGINRSLEVHSNRSQSRQSMRLHASGEDTPVFTIGGEQIPGRDSQIKPDDSRGFLTQLPARYEEDKLRNVISRSLRRVADQNK